MAQTSTKDAGSESQMEAPSATVKKPHAVWTAADNETLVGVFDNITKKGECADNGWKKLACNAVAKALANPSAGGEKTADGCYNHWTKQVHFSLIVFGVPF